VSSRASSSSSSSVVVVVVVTDPHRRIGHILFHTVYAYTNGGVLDTHGHCQCHRHRHTVARADGRTDGRTHARTHAWRSAVDVCRVQPREWVARG
jgi:hypothetical protein